MQEIYYALTLEIAGEMNKKFTMFFSVLIILAFIGYIIFDTARPEGFTNNSTPAKESNSIPDAWKVSGEITVKEGPLTSVTVSPEGIIYLGGDSYVSCYSKDRKQIWSIKTPYPVTSLSNYGDSIFASTMQIILIISSEGKIMDEWGPFEDKEFITSISSNKSYVAFADAVNKMIFILDKKGAVKKLIGQNDGQFVVPSPYFDVAMGTDNTVYIANTGHRRIETRNIEGDLKGYFGDPGTAPGAFCGCCNPAHFIIIPEGFVTAEKGINRIKILNKTGEFVEFVTSKNKFKPSEPLDLASADGRTIYAANPADSKLYIFTRDN
jgi:hypothetical protein